TGGVILIPMKDLMITVASWEERFLLGFQRSLKTYSPRKVIIFYYADYADRTKDNRAKALKECKGNNIQGIEKEITFKSPDNSWFVFQDCLEKEKLESKKVLLDITTMPRDSIFALLS